MPDVWWDWKETFRWLNFRREKLKQLIWLAILLPTFTFADNSWNDYHWARTTSSFDLTIVNSTTSDWDVYVTQATSDWSNSVVLNLIEDVTGDTKTKTRRRCKGPDGQIRICNLTYGQTGWLAVAGITIDINGHIIKGYTKLNDTYFSMDFYNNANWKLSVTCQELGHNVGLDHQDEDFNNTSLFTCMDYQNPPYEYPNSHDFEQLELIYGHLDSYDSYDVGGEPEPEPDTCKAPPGRGCNKAAVEGNSGWGISLGRRGQSETFLRIDRNGTRQLTHVTWAIGY